MLGAVRGEGIRWGEALGCMDPGGKVNYRYFGSGERKGKGRKVK